MSIRDNLERLLASGQDTPLLRFSLGGECLKAADYDAAREHLGRALELDPNYSAAWKLYGKALAAAGEQEAALTAYDRGISVAEAGGDIQAAKEMRVFRKRLGKQPPVDS